MTNKDLKKQYIKEFGYSYFNKYNNTDYSKWLESQLISALNEVIKLGLHSVSTIVNCEHENETLHQGNGFVYKTCTNCGEDI